MIANPSCQPVLPTARSTAPDSCSGAAEELAPARDGVADADTAAATIDAASFVARRGSPDWQPDTLVSTTAAATAPTPARRHLASIVGPLTSLARFGGVEKVSSGGGGIASVLALPEVRASTVEDPPVFSVLELVLFFPADTSFVAADTYLWYSRPRGILYRRHAESYNLGMATVNISAARENLQSVVDTARVEAVYLERYGKRVAVLISPERYEALLDALEEAEDVAAFDAAMAEEGENIPWDQVKADLGWV